MAIAKLNLKPGLYFAGIDRPWYASQSAVRSEIGKRLGLTDVRFFSRKSVAPPVNPKIDPRYQDDWDEWISARYSGPVKVVDAERLWKWVVRTNEDAAHPLQLPAPSSTPANVETSTTPSGGGALVMLGGLGAMLLAVTYAARR